MSDLKHVTVYALSSAAGTGASFFVATLPIVQWGAAVVAIMAGLITILIAMVKLRTWWKSRNS